MASRTTRDVLRLTSAAVITVAVMGVIAVLVVVHLWFAATDRYTCPDVDGEAGTQVGGGWAEPQWCDHPTLGRQDVVVEPFDLRDPWWSAVGLVALSGLTVLAGVHLDRAVARRLHRPELPRSGPILDPWTAAAADAE